MTAPRDVTAASPLHALASSFADLWARADATAPAICEALGALASLLVDAGRAAEAEELAGRACARFPEDAGLAAIDEELAFTRWSLARRMAYGAACATHALTGLAADGPSVGTALRAVALAWRAAADETIDAGDLDATRAALATERATHEEDSCPWYVARLGGALLGILADRGARELRRTTWAAVDLVDERSGALDEERAWQRAARDAVEQAGDDGAHAVATALAATAQA